MAKRALMIGIDNYYCGLTLAGCVADARSMRDILRTNQNDSPNYDCRLLIAPNPEDEQEESAAPEEDGTYKKEITFQVLREQLEELFASSRDDHVLFYFAGHGATTKDGVFLATQIPEGSFPGLPMSHLLAMANESDAKSVLLILDCCHSGPSTSPNIFQVTSNPQTNPYIREGVTLLAASRSTQAAAAVGEHGVFTKLLLGALSGGAADVRGRVSAASIYAYVEQSLGSWDQRPLYLSNADHLPPVRLCEPAVPDSLLRELPTIFPEPDSQFRMAPSFEHTYPEAKAEHVSLFKKFKLLRNAGLLTTQDQKDLYYIALDLGWVKLTPLGQFYWDLAKRKRL